MLNVKTKLHISPDKSIFALPRGLDLELFITYHDNQGAVFTAVRTDMKMRTNRLDKVSFVTKICFINKLQYLIYYILKKICFLFYQVHLKRGEINGTLLASLANFGQTMLKVWDEATPHISEDYFKFSVDHLISPAKVRIYTKGAKISFSL